MPLGDIREVKIKKVEALKKSGLDPYPAVSLRSHKISEAVSDFDNLESDKKEVALTGRILAVREHGGSIFFDFDDGSASFTAAGKFQALLKEDLIGAGNFSTFKNLIDIGDFISVSGILFKTKKNEKTIEVKNYALLSKALLPMPEKWHGLQDVEERFRKRYLDLIFNQDVKNKFLTRFKILDLLRDFFKANDFLEVETPILQPLPGGATARPFKTHLHYLDMDMYLRVAPELYLKRLLVGGFERVFEIARNFRNEGMDREHNPEFNMLEAYVAYQDYEWMMNFVEEMMEFLSGRLFGKNEFEYDGKKISLKRPFKKIEFNEIIREISGLNYDEAGEKDLKNKAQELGIKTEKNMTKGVIADEIFKKVYRPKVVDPVFVINHPLELSPLAKKIPDNPDHVERFQFLIGGFELVNAFSELNDPIDQRERLKEQEKLRQKGDDEAQRFDEDFIEALEYGMPPASGIGIGVDRLIALLTNSHSLREVLLFPIMKSRTR